MKSIDELTHQDFFFCYTKKLSDFLKENNVNYLLKAHSVKDGSVFTLYTRTKKLQKLLVEFKENQ